MQRTLPLALFLLSLSAVLLGCQRSTPPPVTHPVQGKVLLDGQLLTEGAVEFQALAEPSWTTLGDINTDGVFTLSTLHEGKRVPGAIAGEYRVTVLFASRDAKQKRSPLTLAKTYTVKAGDNAFTIEAATP
jgi:hypothetical protein